MKYYYLLDSRAGTLSAKHGGRNVSELDDEPQRFLLLTGTPKEVCKEANNNSYGNNCVVSDSNYNIQWDWFSAGVWNKPKLK